MSLYSQSRKNYINIGLNISITVADINLVLNMYVGLLVFKYNVPFQDGSC